MLLDKTLSIKPQNFSRSLGLDYTLIACGGHRLANQPLQHEVHFPAHEVDLWAICWNPEPTVPTLHRCPQNINKPGVFGKHELYSPCTKGLHSTCSAVSLGSPVLLSVCLRADLCQHGACVQDFQMSSSSSVPQGSDKACNIFRFY